MSALLASIGLLLAPVGGSAEMDLGAMVGTLLGVALGAGVVVLWARKAIRDRPVTATAPCPSCRATGARAVTFSWWGGVLGPKLLNHVECVRCGTTFNGRSGQPNTLGIAVYLLVSLVVIGLVLWKVFPWSVFA